MANKKDITFSQLTTIKPVTDSQKNVFESWKKDKNQFLFGCAGTGKTFISLYLALKQVLNPETPFDRVIVVRSLIPTREIGFLPGDEEDKAALYQVPSDLTKLNEKNGLMDFLQILQNMDEFDCTEFNIGDIVRSGFVRNYLIQKTKLGMGIE